MHDTTTSRRAALILAALPLAGCGGGSPAGDGGNSGDFLLLRVTPPNNAALFLNDAIQFDFSHSVDLATVDLNSVSFTTFDLSGRPLGEQPRGVFRLAVTPGDPEPGRRLEFVPLLPSDDLFGNGGFRAARRYVVQLVGGDRRNGVVLRDLRGRELSRPLSFSFTTVDGTTAPELFRNPRPGGPRRANFAVLPSVLSPDGVRVVDPSFNAAAPLEVRLTFDQAINPHSSNLLRLFLAYRDSPASEEEKLTATVEIARNDRDGAVVVLRPLGVLPTNAGVDVRVLAGFEDIAGESNVNDVSYSSAFGHFVVEPRHEPQFDALIERFEPTGAIDLEMPFLEPMAELTEDGLRASLAFAGTDSDLDYEPAAENTILDTDFTRVDLGSGRSLNVTGGTFQFRNVHIPAGHTLIGRGSKPMVWLVTGDMTIAGTLRVDGTDGERVTGGSAEHPAAGGAGACSGGRGGRGSVATDGRSENGEAGFGPGDRPGGGGRGGQHSCQADTRNGCRIGSGGGGGSFATAGDPDFYTAFARFREGGTGRFEAMGGDGRTGCNKTSAGEGLAPGASGPVAFVDGSAGNDFFGAGLRFSDAGLPAARTSGELDAPRGGAGGGGGGDGATDCNNLSSWRSDAKGGGGGGGAGVLIVQCLGSVRILANGRITANGGDGGGGAPNGTSAASAGLAAGAGGGGGSGGMVVLMCSRLDVVRHGEPGHAAYGDADAGFTNRHRGPYDFAIMADGGVGLRGPLSGAMAIRGKYPDAYLANEAPERAGSWHLAQGDRPVGGFGGNGVVQLMTPSLGDADGTGSFFDDSIHFYASDADLLASPPVPLPSAAKKALLGWRGHRDANGRVDDRGHAIVVSENGFNLGDVKPAPILLPVPFGPLSRAVSRPIDLGHVVRTPVRAAEGVGSIVEQGSAGGDPFNSLLAGPTFVFGGTVRGSGSSLDGYLAWDADGAQTAPLVAGSTSAVSRVVPDATFNSRPALRVELTARNPILAQIPGRYTGYLAQLVGANGSLVAQMRVLGHDGTTLHLDARGAAPPAGAVEIVQIVRQFVAVETDGTRGLGPARNGVPLANVRLGFAFYRDPSDLGTRHPAAGFEYGLDVANWDLMRQLRGGHYRFVQYEVVFNTLFSPEASGHVDPDRRLRPSMPRPLVREIVLPLQF